LMLAVDLVGFLILVVVLLRSQRSEKRRLTAFAIQHDGWGVLDTSDLGEKEHGRAGRKLRRAKLRYAYSRDQYGAGHRLTKRAAARLV